MLNAYQLFLLPFLPSAVLVIIFENKYSTTSYLLLCTVHGVGNLWVISHHYLFSQWTATDTLQTVSTVIIFVNKKCKKLSFFMTFCIDICDIYYLEAPHRSNRCVERGAHVVSCLSDARQAADGEDRNSLIHNVRAHPQQEEHLRIQQAWHEKDSLIYLIPYNTTH
jgi:hypothetical protein